MEGFLLDTMSVLWMGFLPHLIPKRATEVFENSDNRILYSTVNLWEIGLKMGRGGYREFVLPDDWEIEIPRELDALGIARVEILPTHCRLVQNLPFHHKDPFDRMLIAQALTGNLTVLGSDEAFDEYGVSRVW